MDKLDNARPQDESPRELSSDQLLLNRMLTTGLRRTLELDPTYTERQRSTDQELKNALRYIDIIKEKRNPRYASVEDIAVENAVGAFVPGVCAVLKVAAETEGMPPVPLKRQLAILYIAFQISSEFADRRSFIMTQRGDANIDIQLRRASLDKEQAAILRKASGDDEIVKLLDQYDSRLLNLKHLRREQKFPEKTN